MESANGPGHSQWMGHEVQNSPAENVFRRIYVSDSRRMIVASEPDKGGRAALGRRQSMDKFDAVYVDQRILKLSHCDECRKAPYIDMRNR